MATKTKKPKKAKPAPKAKSKKTATKTFKGRTLVSVILDSSGSMSGVAPEVIGGYNAYIRDLRKQKGTFLVSLTQFDTESRKTYTATPVKDVPPVDNVTYQPNGFTALFDAIGDTVEDVSKAATKDDRVLVVIITDGQENASQRVKTLDAVRSIIKAREAQGNWTFTYLSAAVDAFADGAKLGMGVNNTNSFVPSAGGTTKAFSTLSIATRSYSQAPVASVANFYSSDKKGKSKKSK